MTPGVPLGSLLPPAQPGAQPGAQPKPAQPAPKPPKVLDVGVGKYDVVVQVGPSYKSRRQEAVAAMMALVQANPTIFPIIGDLMIREMDWPMAKEIADRLKKMLPQQLQDGDDNDPQAQLQQLSTQHAALVKEVQLLTQQLQQANHVIATKKMEQQGKLALVLAEGRIKLALAMVQRGTTLGAAEINTKAQVGIAREAGDRELFELLHNAAQMVATAATQPAEEQPGAEDEAQV